MGRCSVWKGVPPFPLISKTKLENGILEKVAQVCFIYGCVKQCEASLVIRIESCSIYRKLNRNWKYFSVLEKTFLENTIYCKIILVNNITSIILVNINVFLVLLRPNDLLAENKDHSQRFYFLMLKRSGQATVRQRPETSDLHWLQLHFCEKFLTVQLKKILCRFTYKI